MATLPDRSLVSGPQAQPAPFLLQQQVPEVTSPRGTWSLKRSLGQTTLKHKLPRATGTGAMATSLPPAPPGGHPEVTRQTSQGLRNMNESPGQQG